MKLKIFDSPSEKNKIRISLLDNDGNETQVEGEYISSPFSPSSRKVISSYFNNINQNSNPDGITQKIISLGTSLGNVFLDDDDEIYKITSLIEEHYNHLDIIIESTHAQLFDEYWENIILPGTEYILSSVCKSFVRRPRVFYGQEEMPALHLGLQVPAAVPKEVQALEAADTPPTPIQPMNVLHLTLSSVFESEDYSACALPLAYETVCMEGAISSEHLIVDSADQVRDFLAKKKSEFHLVLVEGGLLPTECGLALGNEKQRVLADDLFNHLQRHGITAIIFDPRSSALVDNDNLKLYIEQLANAACECGIYNLLAINECVDGIVSKDVITAFYHCLTQGLSFAQAVVECRKYLQQHLTYNPDRLLPCPIVSWPLLVHYTAQELTYFVVPQSSATVDQSQMLQAILSMMHGFDQSLVRETDKAINQRSVAQILTAIKDGKHLICINGHSGTGRTTVMHQACYFLLQSKQITNGFYLNYDLEFYDRATILQMLAPELDVKSGQDNDVLNALKKSCNLFVFDNLDELDTQFTQLKLFIDELVELGQAIICSGANSRLTVFEAGADCGEIDIVHLQQSELRRLINMTIRNSGKLPEDNAECNSIDMKVSQWLDIAPDNLFIASRMATKLLDHEVQLLNSDVIQHIDFEKNIKISAQYSAWQWQQLPMADKKLLALFAESEWLLLEVFAIAANKERAFAPAATLCEMLGVSADPDIEAIFSRWHEAGFVKRHTFGRQIENRQRGLILKLAEQDFGSELLNETVQLAFSQVVCEGLRILCSHLIKNQNEALLYNLMLNRRCFVAHFERLWFAKNYQNFVSIIVLFENLMSQVKLEHDLHTWAFDLLSRSKLQDAESDCTVQEKLAFLDLAALAIKAKELPHEQSNFKAYIDTWYRYLNSLDSVDEQALLIFHKALRVVEGFYLTQQNWLICIELANAGIKVYKNHQSWMYVITQLKSLCRYFGEVEQFEDVENCEEQIINDIPYDNAPKGLKENQVIEIIYARLNRKDLNKAKKLLDYFIHKYQSDLFHEDVMWIQGEIAIQEGEHATAIKVYLDIWQKAIQSGQTQMQTIVASRLALIKTDLGQAAFEQLLSEHTDKDMMDTIVKQIQQN
ncbi:hypothetical protein PSECIP111951_04074 [Pseudoalteromonas holothuriae]|uniref:AAA+ ATPase domain-containing protein n=1 Tax=Pseudoalteromonas holothuriae TaxID=2963714 RepID=A0ABM9GNI7_9GAMM|nr:hypothetical protein [Pseudoalteromonas sp. CIP111951]CAH9068217.1 hypothetical protein PSECIP111951_04074 [Pseudoalteromonas sp. CIP111951]